MPGRFVGRSGYGVGQGRTQLRHRGVKGRELTLWTNVRSEGVAAPASEFDSERAGSGIDLKHFDIQIGDGKGVPVSRLEAYPAIINH